jgi:tRNA(Ile)-lysidine synthase
MMIKLQGKLPRSIYLACSGGVDSMAALDFLSRNHSVHVLHFNHDEGNSDEAEEFVVEYCKNRDIKVTVGKTSRLRNKNESIEEYWRNERYKYFECFNDFPIVTCHQLNDCIETWIWSCLNGEGKIIPYRNNNVIRPFRLTMKSDFENWCRIKTVPWFEDESNQNVRFIRNYIRNELIPKALVVNPGIHRVIMRKVKQDEATIESYSRNVSPGYGVVC